MRVAALAIYNKGGDESSYDLRPGCVLYLAKYGGSCSTNRRWFDAVASATSSPLILNFRFLLPMASFISILTRQIPTSTRFRRVVDSYSGITLSLQPGPAIRRSSVMGFFTWGRIIVLLRPGEEVMDIFYGATHLPLRWSGIHK